MAKVSLTLDTRGKKNTVYLPGFALASSGPELSKGWNENDRMRYGCYEDEMDAKRNSQQEQIDEIYLSVSCHGPVYLI